MSKLSPQAQIRHDNALSKFKKSWQQKCIEADAARPPVNEHKITHERFDPRGRAIVEAMEKEVE